MKPKTKVLMGKIKFILTCWMPVSKYRFVQYQQRVISVLEAFRESDLQHHQMERGIIEQMRCLAEAKKATKEKEKGDDVSYV